MCGFTCLEYLQGCDRAIPEKSRSQKESGGSIGVNKPGGSVQHCTNNPYYLYFNFLRFMVFELEEFKVWARIHVLIYI